MNEAAARWLRLAALSPLLAAAASWEGAVALAIATLGTLVCTAFATAALRRYVAPHQRPVAVALVAAVAATAIDLLLQAFCFRIAQSLHDWLPLVAVLPVLFDRIDAPDASIAAALRGAGSRAAAIATGLLIGAALRGALSNEAGIAACAIASGLALALVGRHAPPPSTPTKPASPRVRARVTGPLR